MQLSVKKYLMAFCIAVMSWSNSSAETRAGGLKAFAKSQGDLKIIFMECAMKVRLFNLAEKSSAAGKRHLDEAAGCFAKLEASVEKRSNDYKALNDIENCHKLADMWENEYKSVVKLAIKHQSNEEMPEKMLGHINEINKEIFGQLEKEESKDEYVRKVLESPLRPVDP